MHSLKGDSIQPAQDHAIDGMSASSASESGGMLYECLDYVKNTALGRLVTGNSTGVGDCALGIAEGWLALAAVSGAALAATAFLETRGAAKVAQQAVSRSAAMECGFARSAASFGESAVDLSMMSKVSRRAAFFESSAQARQGLPLLAESRLPLQSRMMSDLDLGLSTRQMSMYERLSKPHWN